MAPRAAAGLSETRIWESLAAAANGLGVLAVPVKRPLPTMQLLDAARESSLFRPGY